LNSNEAQSVWSAKNIVHTLCNSNYTRRRLLAAHPLGSKMNVAPLFLQAFKANRWQPTVRNTSTCCFIELHSRLIYQATNSALRRRCFFSLYIYIHYIKCTYAVYLEHNLFSLPSDTHLCGSRRRNASVCLCFCCQPLWRTQ
jgi:hypothetical protein